MKKIFIKIAILSLVLGTFTSCIDSLLDKKPISEYSSQSFYKNDAQAMAGVYGIYNGLQSVVRLNFAFWGEGRADNVKTKHGGETTFLLNNTLNPSISSADWTALYTMISRANYAIKYIPELYKEGNETGNSLIGQAKALRALAYFYLVRVWGDVPLILEPYTNVQQNLFVTKNTKEEVLNQIEADLLDAQSKCVVKFNSTNDKIMFNKTNATALLVHVYMWRHKYSEAIAAADLVIGSPLYKLVGDMASWGKMFTDSYASESLFEVGFNDTQTNGLRVLYAIGSDSHYTPSESFKTSFEAGDLRRSYIYDTTLDDPRCIWKYLGKGVSDAVATPSKQNIILIRLSDIIMLKAEALAMQSSNAAALALLDPIRKRAGITPTTLTEAQAVALHGSVLNTILHERSIELCFEGHRWFDLVRTDKAISTMKPINGLSDVKNLVWPIHENTLNMNPQIEQNEYYK